MMRPRSLLQRSQRLWRTVSHLRPQQIGGQVWVRLRPLWEPLLHTPSPGKAPTSQWSPEAHWHPPPSHHSADDLRDGRFCFTNDLHTTSWPPDWQAAETPLLWQYNLHYFEWMWALPPDDAFTAARDWIAAGGPSEAAHAGWAPYPTSLRLLNWCGYFFVHHANWLQRYPHHRETLWQSIHAQATWLSQHLEHHLMGNHLLENAAALALVGSGFAGEDAKGWLATGKALLAQELPEQILPDGMHFERSPMYHLRIFYLLLLLRDVGASEVAALAAPQLPKMARSMALLCHADAEIALFNDSAFGIYHPPRQLLDWYTQQDTTASASSAITNALAPQGPFVLAHAGYYGAHTAEGHSLICDAGPLAPDYIPGHAHADIFSFELSLHGHRVIVDSGVCDYVDSDTRRYCRSTAAHNTIAIEGMDQGEMWGAFRVARRGRPHKVTWAHTHNGFRLQSSHDGYQRLHQARHLRRFQWHDQGKLSVQDEITANASVSSASYLHFHPDCTLLELSPQHASISTPAGKVDVQWQGEGSAAAEKGHYCPRFGQAIPNLVLVYRAKGATIRQGYTITHDHSHRS